MSKDDSMYDDLMPDEFSGGDLKYLESYKELEVDLVVDGIRSDAKLLIENLCDLYLGQDLITDDTYTQALAAIEVNQLTSAMMAAKSVEHALATLMRQLDAGGYVNAEIFTQIKDLSKASMELTMKATTYLRSLPDFFKYTSDELKERGHVKPIEIVQTNMSIGANSSEAVIEEQQDEQYSLSGPIRGTRALMLQIRDEANNLDEMIEQAKKDQAEIEKENLNSDDEATDF